MIDDSKSFEESVENVDLFERYLKKLSKFDLGMLVFALMKAKNITDKNEFCRDVLLETKRLRKDGEQ